MITTDIIDIDLASHGAGHVVNAVQNDKYSRNIVVNLYFNGSRFLIPDGTTVVASYNKPDGTGGIYDSMPDESIAWEIDGNSVTVALAPQVLTVAGMVNFSITLIQGKFEISVFSISIHVHPFPSFTAQSEDYVSVREWISEELEKAIEEAKENGELNGAPGKSAYQYAKEGGYTGTEEEFAKKLAKGYSGVTVADYGAKGDGSADDTAAFQTALAENRVVFVPGGTYKLSGTLVNKENCCLELSQDTILQFTQTSGNCIEMRGSAVLRGNHAMISVPYAFTGNVISMDTSQDGTNHNNIPPYLHSGSHMFKRQRFVYDINILKPDANGICKSTDGKCNGTAIYMHCLGTASIRWMWAITMSGVRIAGGFQYGIRAYNIDKAGDYADNAWNHDMRIEAVIESCEVGVALENCNGAHLAVTIQPHATDSGVKYAKHGIYLNDARYIDMIGSRVWDWNADNTLWTSGGQYQHIALVGNCRGLLLDDFLCHESAADIRDLIYTDTPSNFDTMSILQEPASKWFKSVEGEPYFNDGNGEKRLAMKSDIDEYFQTDRIAQFTDVLATSIDKDGNIYGTASGYYDSKFQTLTDGSAGAYHIHTGFIPCKKGDTFITDGIGMRDEGNVRVSFFDSNFNYILNVSGKNMIAGNYHVEPCVITDSGFRLTIKNLNDANLNNIAYARFNFHIYDVGERPVMSINEEIMFTQAGFLADGIKVKGENVIGGTSGGGSGIDVTAEVGQTIVVEEVDENGKPTKWKAADYQPRTHYTEGIDVVLFEGVFNNRKNTAAYALEPAVSFTPGKKYTVTLDGVAYVAEAYLDQDCVTIGTHYDSDTCAFDYSEFPFSFYSYDDDGLVCEGSCSTTGDHTLTIVEDNKTVHKIDPKFLPEGVGYSEVKEILPEITVELDPEAGMGVIPVDFTVEAGKEYMVKYNGVEYVTTCMEVAGTFALGNAGALGGGVPVTTEPFCLAYSVLDHDENDNPIMGWAVAALDGSASVTLSIKGEVVTKIPAKYTSNCCVIPITKLPSADSSIYGDMNFNITMDTTELVNALRNGLPVYLDLTALNDGVDKRLTVIDWACFGQPLDTLVGVYGISAVPLYLYAQVHDATSSYMHKVVINITD
jgi:hypothetical protein